MKEKIIALLSGGGYQEESVEKYAAYCQRLILEKNKDGTLKNPFMQHKKDQELADLYKRVAAEGLDFDGKHITIQSTGVSYDYVAYKNKMLLAYPESKIDVAVVNEGDTFNFSKEDGRITYKHEFTDPFKTSTKESIIGAYCVIKNERGEFLTLLSAEEIEKHRKVAKTDFIWRAWFKEMVLKTVIKKACKVHFDDVTAKIEEQDNENYDLEIPVTLDLKYKQDVDAIDTIEALQEYYLANKGIGKDFDKYVMMRKNQLKDKNHAKTI